VEATVKGVVLKFQIGAAWRLLARSPTPGMVPRMGSDSTPMGKAEELTRIGRRMREKLESRRKGGIVWRAKTEPSRVPFPYMSVDTSSLHSGDMRIKQCLVSQRGSLTQSSASSPSHHRLLNQRHVKSATKKGLPRASTFHALCHWLTKARS
jgi:hypothetical protein